MRLYRFAVEHGDRWPLGKIRHVSTAARPRVGYYLWRFPSCTETFIQREVRALRQAGLDVEVFADLREPDALLDVDARSFIDGTHYLLPMDPDRLRSYRRRVLRRDPLGGLNAFAYTVLHRYARHKRPREDRRVFQQALYLAGHAREHGLTHLHCPWADLNAFIGLLAARMAGIPYSVQARASADLYRDRSRAGLVEKLSQARFIVTNSEFNRAFIERIVPQSDSVPIHVIYEGLDLSRFAVPCRQRRAGAPLRILSVGRLIEEKGFEHLLRGLALLREHGRAFHCVIVGGAEAGLSRGYDQHLQDLRQSLHLDDAVHFAGALPFDRVLQECALADVFVMPSVVARDGGRDVTPNALLEAMATQRAVVATNLSAIPEIVEHRVSGIVVPPRNPPALAQALLELADDPALAERLGANARRRIEERFDIRKNAQRYLELFLNSARRGLDSIEGGTADRDGVGAGASTPGN